MDNTKRVNSRVETNHYFSKFYDKKKRFISYWHQINEIIQLNLNNVLEIGIGNGFVCKYLKERGMTIVTLDIDRRLNPDGVGDVRNIPFKDGSFNVVACYELLEHLPYKNFYNILSEIFRVSNSYAIISLPEETRVCRLHIQIPKILSIKALIPLPRFKNPHHQFNGKHYWEIGKAGYSLKKIIKEIKGVGFEIVKTYRIFEHPYHRFFVLKKRGSYAQDGASYQSNF